MITLIGGNIQGPNNLAVPLGSVVFQLNTDATVIAAPHGFVAADVPVVFQFDATGNLIQPAKLWSNEELQPQLSPTLLGTYYLVTFYSQAGARLNAVPLWFQFPEISGSTVDIGNVTPISTIGGNLIFYPTNFSGGTGSVTSVTFTGDGTILSATPSAPVTTSGTLTATLLTQNANRVLAGPTSGGAALPTFRALVAADVTGLTSTPGGATTNIQTNIGGSFYGDGNFRYTPTGIPTVNLLGNFTETGVMTVTGPAIASTVPGNFITTNNGPTNRGKAVIAMSDSAGGTVCYFVKDGNKFSIINDGLLIPGSGQFNWTSAGLGVDGGSNSPSLNLFTGAAGVGSGIGTGSAVISLFNTGTAPHVFAVISTGPPSSGQFMFDPFASAFTLLNPTAATNIANQNAPTTIITGNYWTGSASATDMWEVGAALGTGSNPTSTLEFIHVGSSGAAVVQMPNLQLTAATPTGAAGQLSFGTTTATSATAGTNGDVPAQVVGYLVIDIAGTKFKVPYYNV